jgi:prepilin peptidase CpaA
MRFTRSSGPASHRTLPTSPNLTFVALASGALIATVIDLKTRRIPNIVTMTMAGIGLGLAASGVSGFSLGAAFLGLVVGLGLMLPGYALGATGAGDVKLMAAIGTMVGPWVVVKAFLFTGIAGGVIAVLVALKRRRLAMTVAGTARLIAAPSGARDELTMAPSSSRFAYGPAIAIGSVIAALMG